MTDTNDYEEITNSPNVTDSSFEQNLSPMQREQISQLTYNAQQNEQFSIWRLSYEELIAELADKNLAGLDWNALDKKWVKVSNPLMNDEGRHLVRTLVVSYVNKVSSMTQYTPYEVDSEVAKFELDIGSALAFRYHLLGVDPANRRQIRHMLVALIDAGMKKSIAGKERESFMKMLQERMVYSQQAAEPKGMMR
jgi:hypothetical protein